MTVVVMTYEDCVDVIEGMLNASIVDGHDIRVRCLEQILEEFENEHERRLQDREDC